MKEKLANKQQDNAEGRKEGRRAEKRHSRLAQQLSQINDREESSREGQSHRRQA